MPITTDFPAILGARTKAALTAADIDMAKVNAERQALEADIAWESADSASVKDSKIRWRGIVEIVEAGFRGRKYTDGDGLSEATRIRLSSPTAHQLQAAGAASHGTANAASDIFTRVFVIARARQLLAE